MHISANIDVRDALIAATAIEHGMIVATRNTKHLVNAGVKLINPWV
jgi:toxin FitB